MQQQQQQYSSISHRQQYSSQHKSFELTFCDSVLAHVLHVYVYAHSYYVEKGFSCFVAARITNLL